MPKKPTRKPFYSQEHESWAIPLTHGVVALVDADMSSLLGQHNWGANRQHRQWYAKRNAPEPDGKQSAVCMHRVIMNAPTGMDVDHRKHFSVDQLIIDNRRANLRVCTHAENQRNQRAHRGGRSKFKGVSWHKHARKWNARIKVDRKSISLGYFTEEIEAARAYDVAALTHHGDFALTNKALGLI